MTTTVAPGSRVLTVPNLLSALRIAGVPVFVWMVLGPHYDGAALLVLMGAGASDYLDGKLARMLGQTSALGAFLDPLADRLYILATIVCLTLRDVVPLWVPIAIIGRDLVLLGFVPTLRRLGYGTTVPVHFLGKAATFNLLYAFPLLLAGAGSGVFATAARPTGWAFTLWGIGLYWWAGVRYAVQIRQLARDARVAGGTAAPA